MYKVDEKKWHKFTPNIQLKNIATELSRATNAILHSEKEKNDSEWAENAYERAIILIDASLADPQWENKEMLYQLRDAIAVLYTENTHPAIGRFICAQLLSHKA